MANTQLALPDDGIPPQALEHLSKSIRRQAKNQIERVIVEGYVTNMRDQVRAGLTNSALQNAGALSALEDHLVQVAPSGANRYRHIVDAYALAAANMIARW